MIYALVSKEIKDLFRSNTALIYFLLLFTIIAYSFFSSVDLYSKASETAINNPLYATGFEPVPGVFVPTFGGFFIIISLIAPFLFIQSISNEKKHNTLPLLAQLPYPLSVIFLSKLFAAAILVIVSILFFAPVFFSWYLLGGHIPWQEITLLIVGYVLYSLFVISISYFSAAIFKTSSQASIFTVAFIMVSWFVDFGKEMNVVPLFNRLSEWTVTTQLNEFEDGILSLQSIIYFILLASFLTFLSFTFFNFSLRRKIKRVLVAVLCYSILFAIIVNVQYKRDISESKKNSFSPAHTEFLTKLPEIDIKIFLETTDSRYKDYQRDFLKKLKMVKNDLVLHFVAGESLRSNYGRFEYTVNNKSMETFSNSEEEIFMIFEEISGLKIETSKDDSQFCGYPLVVKKKWSVYLFILYLIILPLVILFIRYYKQLTLKRVALMGFKRRRKDETQD
jgi:ABC-2 type transport system permease protein